MKKIGVVLLIIFVFTMLFTACKSAEEKYAEKMLEKNLEAAGLEGDVNIGKDGSISMSGDGMNVNINADEDWPEYIPKEVPEFKKGEVYASSQMGNNISITLNYDKSSQFDDYLKEYKSWNLLNEYSDDESGERSFTYEKDSTMVSLMDNGAQVTINISSN